MHPLLLLAALAAADAGTPERRPPAQLVVPESMRRQREQQEKDGDESAQLGLLSPELLAALGPLKPKPGEWVEYAVHERGKQVAQVRLSVLAPPAEAGEGRYWLEITTVGGGAFPSAIRLLVHGDPRNPKDIERLVLYIAGQAPLDLPADEAKDQLPLVEPRGRAKVSHLKPAEVKVPGGKFHASRLQITAQGSSTRVWLARSEVPLWGLVRSEGAGRVLELVAWGKQGAHTVVPPAPGEPDERPDGGE